MTPTSGPKYSAQQLDTLLARLPSWPDKVVDAHLTDEERLAYFEEKLDAAEVRRCDAHLAGCAECTERIAALFEAQRFWRTEAGQAEMAAFVERLRGALVNAAAALSDAPPRTERCDAWASLTEQLRAGFAALFGGQLPLEASDSLKPLIEATTPDNRTKARVYRTPDGNLSVMVESSDLSLAGRRFAIRFAKLQPPPVTLKRLDENVVFGEVVIPTELAPDDLGGVTVKLELIP